ncbi:hypothetical protein DJ017_16035 [Phenylobacterium soli]|uniref:Uncharacterized protein n=1 Tax=Phenylobacterium soli TaxID=2170551 RepID=A0A328ASL0_9CAUL|nr:hypothetical protein DJ017_16035 [Phenylobacterium soli]
MKLPVDTPYDLQVLTEEFAENDAGKLAEELYRTFRMRGLDGSQEAILDEPWRRIYTTNYDDLVELHRLNRKASPNSFDVSEALPGRLSPGAVIHLHGSIRKVTAENVTESLVLGEASYVNQYVVKSPWYDQFQRDIAFASALYIIGYSLADYHIAALLLEDPEVATRTVFIQGPTPDEVFRRRTARYGRVAFIGTNGFADVLKTAPRAEAPSLTMLHAFRPLSPLRDRRASGRATAPEVYDLLVYGDLNVGRLAQTQPGESYAISRSTKVREAADLVERNASVVIDGRLGNGKTVFLHLLAFELERRGWTCLSFRPGHPDVAKELAALREAKRLVLFIEQYAAAQDAIDGLKAALPDGRFVVEIRTGTFEVRYHELAQLLPKPFDRISLNTLSSSEIEAFGNLCQNAGLPRPVAGRGIDLRDLLLELLNSQTIRERIELALRPLFEVRATRRVVGMTLLIASHQTSVGAGFVRSVIGTDPFAALRLQHDLANEIFELSADRFRARSAVFSNFVINAFMDPKEIADLVVEITLAAAERRNERPYRLLMSNMMAYSSLRRTLDGRPGPDHPILSVYERLRHDQRVNREPLFWLQYAIAMADIPKLDAAGEFIDHAYRTAQALPGFQTFQIDTQAFRISIMRAMDEPKGSPVSSIERILEGIERIDGMLSKDSHRAYAVRVLDGVEPFVRSRGTDLQPAERTAMQIWLHRVAASLAALPDDFAATSGSEQVRAQIQVAAERLSQLGA